METYRHDDWRICKVGVKADHSEGYVIKYFVDKLVDKACWKNIEIFNSEYLAKKFIGRKK